MNAELLSSFSNLPFIHNGQFYDSLRLKQNKSCIEKCIQKDCLVFFEQNPNNDEYLCSMKYNNKAVKISGLQYIFNGLIFNNNNSILQSRKEARKERIISNEQFNTFVEELKEIENSITKYTNETMVKNFSMFHDFKTSMSIFFNCTQDLINKLEGNSFEEKLENSDKSHKDLFNALALITSQLRMIDVIINPKSIVFGSKKLINIYRLFEKIKSLFSHLSTKKKDINIVLISEAWVNDSLCYDSIEFIPLILLDNALKYSVSDSNIEIKFEQNHSSVKILVKSIGPFVCEENKEKIFEKFFRDKSAEEFSKEGIGVGLWIARQILLAHDSNIKYLRDPKETRPIGLNIFEFDLNTIR